MSLMRALARWGLPLLAGAGFGLAIAKARLTVEPPPVAPPVAEPAAAPYAQFIAGAGLIEALGRNVSVATPAAGVIAEVFVRAGEDVAKGAPLFRLDARELEAERAQRAAQLAATRAKVEEADATLQDYRNQLAFAENVTVRGAVSAEDLAKRRLAVRLHEAKLATAKADVAAAEAELDATAINIDRRTVRAPIDGRVLRLDARPGQFAQTGEGTNLVVMGRVDRLAVRIDIDENDAWRFVPGQPGRAFLRGNKDLYADLTFESVEPYVRPKEQLTGSSTERVDTRVLQVVFSFPSDAMPAYVGQQVDAFIAVGRRPAEEDGARAAQGPSGAIPR